jgi:hypothetical protein
MVNPEREPLCGIVEADETIIPFRTKEDPIVRTGSWASAFGSQSP